MSVTIFGKLYVSTIFAKNCRFTCLLTTGIRYCVTSHQLIALNDLVIFLMAIVIF